MTALRSLAIFGLAVIGGAALALAVSLAAEVVR